MGRRAFCAGAGISALATIVPTPGLFAAETVNDLPHTESPLADMPFPYDVSEDLRLASCRIDISTRDARPLNKLLYGFNTNMASAHSGGPRYDAPAIVEAVSALRPGLLRFPGGTISNWYNWRNDDFDTPPERAPDFAKKLVAYRKEAKGYGYVAFKALIEKFNIEPIITVNIFTQAPKDAVAWFESMRADGLKIRYCELGNEVYTKEQKSPETETPEGYISVTKAFARALKEWDPGLRISVNTARRAKRWTSHLAKENYFDAIVYHSYPGSYDDPIRRDIIINYFSVERLIREMVTDFQRDFPNRPVWMTEWNISNKLQKSGYGHTALHALCNTTWWLEFLNHPDTLQLAAYHVLAGAGFGPLELDTEQGMIYPEFSAWQLIGKIQSQCDNVLLTGTSLERPADWQFAPASARAFSGRGRTMILFVNKLPVPKRIEVTIDGGLWRQGGQVDYLSMPSLNWSEKIPLPRSFLEVARFDDTYIAPPYSVNLLDLNN